MILLSNETFIAGKIDYHCYDGVHLWGSRGNRILRSADLGSTWCEYLRVNTSLMTCFAMYNRLTRNGIHNIIPIDKETIAAVVKKRFLVFHQKQLIVEVQIGKGSRPLRQGVLRKDNYIIYGDYWGNPDREPVNIYQFDPHKGDVQVLLSFKNERHIHFIRQDIYDQRKIIIGTGDRDNESGIYSYDLDTGVLKTIGCGSQVWRAVSILQKGEYFYWGSDCPYEQNHIYRHNRRTGVLEKTQPISGPAYYSAVNNEGRMFLATTVEQRKKHRAIIYSSSDGEIWREEGEWNKDFLHEKLFGYGIIEFIYGQEALRDVFINLKALK